MNLPEGFIEMMRGLLGEEADAFLEAMQRPPVTSVRLNSRKPSCAFPLDSEGVSPVKWCPTGRYLKQRPVFTLDPLLHAGAYYVQDASSMIHYEVIRRILKELTHESETPLKVLDMCAAPGGKTTAMIDALPDGSRVIANEYVGKRAGILRENLIKWGYPLAMVTNRDSAWFAQSGDSFDVVAVDAPCSGEGMMRKDEDAVKQWSPELIAQCASLQREILTNAVKALRPGGFLVYSTCTFNREEDEENARFIHEELGLTPFDLKFPEDWGIPGGIDTDLPVYRFMPHKTEGEGLFLAVFRMPGEFEPSLTDSVLKEKDKRSKPTRPAKPIKNGKKPADDVPEIEEILSVDFDRSSHPVVDVSRDQALAYLRRESITLPPETPKGIVIVAYGGLPLGPAKNIGSRANNLYPKNWRILMR